MTVIKSKREKYRRESNKIVENINENDIAFFQPRDTINIVGKLSYKESMQAWNVIQLRKEIVGLFPQLKEKRGKFGYAMLYNRSTKELKNILDLLDKKELVPILLLLGRVREN